MEQILSILIGLVLILVRKKLASLIIRIQNKMWGFKFGEREIKASEVVLVGVGLFLIVNSLSKLTGWGR